MDLRTAMLLGATAFAVIGYAALIYGSCAFDPHCHIRTCGSRHHICGLAYDAEGAWRPR